MKRIAVGIVAGGAAAAAFLTAASANATDSAETPSVTWTPNYTVDNAVILQGQNSLADTWQLPASFTSSEGTVLVGTDYVTRTLWGGIENQFHTTDGAVYAQDQLGLGFTNLYYDADGDGKDVVDYLKTPFGTFNVSSMASVFAPEDVSKLTEASPLEALQNAGLYSALDLGLGEDAGEGSWSPAYDIAGAQLLADKDPFSETWKLDASFTRGDEMLMGTNYVTQSLFGGGINDQFVTDDGAIYAQNQLGLGFTNLYYNSGGDDATVVDILKTPLGNVDLSSIASWFAPADFSDVDAASPLADLQDAGLYSALDLGLLTP